MSRTIGLLFLAAATVCAAGPVSVKLSPTLQGAWRPGWPVALRVFVANEGEALDGLLDVVVEGVTYRQPVQVGARTSAVAEALVAARSEGARARVVVRSTRGEVLCEKALGLGLRRLEASMGLVAAVGSDSAAARGLFGGAAAVVAPGELPTASAGYAALDALAVAGDGADVSAAARAAVGDWVRGGGVAGFLLSDGQPVGTGSLLAELAECAGRPTAQEWLAAVAGRAATRRLNGGLTWRLGLGSVAVGDKEVVREGLFLWLVAGPGDRDVWVDKGVVGSFAEARWTGPVRGRLAGGAVALLVAGALVMRLVPRRWGRLAAVALAFGVAAGLALAAWGLMLPAGKGVLEVAAVAERAPGQPGERRTELVCLGATGRTHARLDFGAAEAVVPFYYSAEEVGAMQGTVLSRDAAGRWTADCELSGAMRRCFAVWWPWRGSAGSEPSAGPEDAQGKGQQALVDWQRRRADGARKSRVRWAAEGRSITQGSGLLEATVRPTLVWTETE